jgi:adenosine deaminase
MNYPFPKVDLHFHLDGAMLPEVAWKLAQQRNIELPADNLEDFKKYLIVTADCRDVFEYLAKFEMPTRILQDQAALSETTYTIIRHIAAQGLVYAEIRFAPQLHTRQNLTQKDAVEAVLDGARSAMAECPSIRIGIILCTMIEPYDNHQANLETVRLAEEYHGRGVVGLDLAGGEDSMPFGSYADLFTEYHRAGYPLTIHAGDNGKPANVATAIDWGATRIGHGKKCWYDKAVMQKVIDTGTTLEVCLTSNIQCKTEPSYQEHPAKKLYDAGVKVTLNTDNMVLSGITLDYEYDRALQDVGFAYNDLIQMNINAIEASFMPEEDKPAYIENLRRYLR